MARAVASANASTPISATRSGVSLCLRITPRAGRDEIAGRSGDAIRIRLKAPPIEGKANQALVALLSRQLGVARSAITIVSGESARNKVVHVVGLSVAEAEQRLLDQL
jgi:hypothetical protein